MSHRIGAYAMKIANRDSRGCVQRQQPFEGSNLYAGFFTVDHTDPSPGQSGYVVFSYGRHFPLYIAIHMGGKDVWFANKDKWSRTTSRHQSQTNPLVSSMHYLTTNGMQTLLNGGYRALIQQRVLTGELA